MKKCNDCVVGTYLECYYDYGGENFMFESTINNESLLKNILNVDCLSLYPYCPFCGNKNNLDIISIASKNPISYYMLYPNFEEVKNYRKN